MTELPIFPCFEILETKRLRIRKYTYDDASDIFEYASNNELTKYLRWEPHTTQYETLEFLNTTIENYLNKNVSPWAIVLKEINKVIGSIGFNAWDYENKKAEIGFVVSPDFHQKGYASEALNCVIDHYFRNDHLNRIEATCHIRNTPSIILLENTGFTREGELRDFFLKHGKTANMYIYSILKNEWI